MLDLKRTITVMLKSVREDVLCAGSKCGYNEDEFSTWQQDPFLTNYSVKTLGEALNEVMCISYLCYTEDVLRCDFGGVCCSISNILSNGAGEKNWLLWKK